ncbi:hypothetical protein ENBRE01_0387 [Enteropsectra breve]|nr:hypothetical protein ENBRE01_0387 [Enteropsectra breve]
MDGGALPRKAPVVYKIIILGETNVGKSSLFMRYTEDSFMETIPNTIGVNNFFKKLVIEGNPVHLQMWDTAGQERFRSIVSAFYRESDGFLLVYDLGNQRSFEYLKQLVDELKDFLDPRFTVLIGNKSDTVDRETLLKSKAQLSSMAQKIGCKYHLVSAKTGENVNRVFEDLSGELYNRKKKAVKERVSFLSSKKNQRIFKFCF